MTLATSLRRALALSLAPALALGLGLSTPSATALAQVSTTVASRRVVEVVFAGGADGVSSLEDTVRELLARLDLVMESRETADLDADDASFRGVSRASLLARVGVDLRSRDVAVVTVIDGRTGDVIVRRTLRRDGPAAVVREELAHVVQSAVDPMILAERDRAAAGLAPSPSPSGPSSPSASPSPPGPSSPSPSPSPSSSTAPSPSRAPGSAASAARAPLGASALPRDDAADAATASSPLALDLSTMAGAGTVAADADLVARAGGGAALVWRRGVRPSVGVSAHYVFPFEAGSDVALAHVAITSLRATAALQAFGNQSFALDVAAGLGADILRVEPRSNALPADHLGPSTTRVDPVATASITGHLSVGSGTSLSLSVAADLDMASRRWVVEAGHERVDAFAPSRLRPLAMLGFTFTPFGEPRFNPRAGRR